MAFRGGTTFPEIIPNMLMCLEYYLIEGLPKILQLKDCRPYYIIFREYVFAHANNIFFFPIIFSLAEKYYAQLQDYAIPLLTNPDFIIFDMDLLIPSLFSLSANEIIKKEKALKKELLPLFERYFTHFAPKCDVYIKSKRFFGSPFLRELVSLSRAKAVFR